VAGWWMAPPVYPQLRKYRCVSGSYAWCQNLPSAIQGQETTAAEQLAYSPMLDSVWCQYDPSDFCAKNRFKQATNLQRGDGAACVRIDPVH
jgi:hypothetical protein